MWLRPGQSACLTKLGLSDWFKNGPVAPACLMSTLLKTFATIYWEHGRHVLSRGIAKLLGYHPGAGTGRGGPHRRGLGTNLRIKPSTRKVQAREERNGSDMIVWCPGSCGGVSHAMEFSVTGADKVSFILKKKKKKKCKVKIVDIVYYCLCRKQCLYMYLLVFVYAFTFFW